jgi:hypothetical protein
MPRAPVLPALVKASRESGSPLYAGGADGPSSDGYAERLIKYIPGEAIAFFLPFASIEGITDGQLIAVLAVCAVIALWWALNREGRLVEDLKRPSWLVLIWSLIAFAAWAIGTSHATQHMLGWPALTCTIILAGSSVVIPMVDDMLVGRLVKGRHANGDDD